MNYAWITDLHLDDRAAFDRLMGELEGVEGILSTGDLCDGVQFATYLREMGERLRVPIFFVLGNHEAYGTSIEGAREAARKLNGVAGITYLSDCEGVWLDEGVAVIGHDGWVDGREGDYLNSPVCSRDLTQISDFFDLRPMELLMRLQELADQAVELIEERLERAFEQCDQVVLLTHVPPCREAARYEGLVADSIWGPHFVCRGLGEVLVREMRRRPHKELLVLCGHAHYACETQVLPNLTVRTGFGCTREGVNRRWRSRQAARPA